MNKALKIFISYSKEDKELLKRFNQHISPLIKLGIIETWKDTDLGAGSDWHYEIQKKLDEAELILFLVSASLLSTDYVYEIEMEMAKKKIEKKKAIVIPIILRHCCWEYTYFGDIQVLPRKGVPITSFEDQDLGWTEVVRDIRNLIFAFTTTTENNANKKN